MKYCKPQIHTFTMDQVTEAIDAAACGSVAGSCYNGGCTYNN